MITMSGLHNDAKPGQHDDSVLDDRWTVIAVKSFKLWTNLERLKEFLDYLKDRYPVQNGKFVLHGHSNGAGGMLKFSCRYPDLCCGLVLFACITDKANIGNLRGIPVAQHYDPNDEHNRAFGRANVRLARTLRGMVANGEIPWAEDRQTQGHSVRALRSGRGKEMVTNEIARMFSAAPAGVAQPVQQTPQKRSLDSASAPEAKRARGQEEECAVAHNVDGHPDVKIKRTINGTRKSIVGAMMNGEIAQVFGRGRGHARVRYETIEGFVKERYIRPIQ